jgi:hypothetical protein
LKEVQQRTIELRKHGREIWPELQHGREICPKLALSGKPNWHTWKGDMPKARHQKKIGSIPTAQSPEKGCRTAKRCGGR